MIERITIAAGAISTIIAYFFGVKKSAAETDKMINDSYKAIMESYNFALESLRKEFESKIQRMEKDIGYLKSKGCKIENCKNRVGF